MRRRDVLAMAPAILAACRPKRGSGFAGYAFVANEEGQAVAAVDLTAFAVARHIPLGSSPTEILAHPARTPVYAVNSRAGTLYEIRTWDLTLGRRVRVSTVVTAPRFAPSGEAIWMLCPEARQLAAVSSDRFQPGSRIALPAVPGDLDISEDGQWAAVSFPAPGMAALVNLSTRRLERVLQVGRTAGFARFRGDGKTLMVANPKDRLLSIFDVPSGRLLVHLPLAVTPRQVCFKHDGGQCFITGEGLDAVVTVYPFQTEVGATTLAGRAPGSLAVSSSPDYLFVANPTTADVTILNIQTQRVIAVAPVGREPCHITITPDNQYALVLNRASGDMAVIRIAAITANRTKSAPLFTMIPVGSRPVSAVVRAV